MIKNIEHLLLQGQKPQRVVAQYQNVNVPHFIQMQLPIYILIYYSALKVYIYLMFKFK